MGEGASGRESGTQPPSAPSGILSSPPQGCDTAETEERQGSSRRCLHLQQTSLSMERPREQQATSGETVISPGTHSRHCDLIQPHRAQPGRSTPSRAESGVALAPGPCGLVLSLAVEMSMQGMQSTWGKQDHSSP